MTQSKREIKAWGVLWGNDLAHYEDLGDKIVFYKTRRKLDKWYGKNSNTYTVVPITITYSLPKKLTK